MLLLPFAVGVMRSGPHLVHVPLLVFWVLAYLAFHATTVWLRTRRRERDRPPVLTYGSLTAALGLALAFARPDLLVWLPAFLACGVVGLWFAHRRDERSLVNDAVTVLAACLFAGVAYDAGYPDGGTIEVGRLGLGAMIVALFAYFFGTVLYVKTLIRERGSRGMRIASIAYHVGWTLAWGVVAVWPHKPPGLPTRSTALLAVLFLLLAVRAAALAGRRIRPRTIGLGELAACLALFAVLATWP